MEGIHDQLRDRYMLGGEGVTARSKRFSSRTAEQLRGSAAMFLDWFRTSLRNGWLGNHPTRNPCVRVRRATNGYTANVKRTRKQLGLALPYGPAAEKLGLTLAVTDDDAAGQAGALQETA